MVIISTRVAFLTNSTNHEPSWDVHLLWTGVCEVGRIWSQNFCIAIKTMAIHHHHDCFMKNRHDILKEHVKIEQGMCL